MFTINFRFYLKKLNSQNSSKKKQNSMSKHDHLELKFPKIQNQHNHKKSYN